MRFAAGINFGCDTWNFSPTGWCCAPTIWRSRWICSRFLPAIAPADLIAGRVVLIINEM